MNNENAVLNDTDLYNDDEAIDLDALEEKLQKQLEEFSDLELLNEKIGNNYDDLGEKIKDVVWEQFVNQFAATAGADFIKENRGMTLDLRKDAHIQTTENFEKGKIATHNTEIDYQKRYDEWQNNFQKDENGNVITHKTRTGKSEATLKKGAREPFDKERPKGSKEKHTDIDHVVSAGEIIRDSAANAHMTKEEQIAFANSEKNLNEMDSSQNRSKGDKSTSDWLDTPNSKGQKPKEIFDISDEQEAELRRKDAEAREEFERLKKKAEERSIESGKKSQRAEAKRIGGKAVRSVLMRLLGDLLKEIIAKLVSWLKSSNRKIQTLFSCLKEAIDSFIHKLKDSLVGALDAALTTIASAIWGPIVTTIKKVVTFIKQGWKSLKEIIEYIKNPENKNKSNGLLLLEIGKIITAGITTAGAIVLGELIEKGLIAIPGVGPLFAVEIPLLGSIANILGIFLGAAISGVVGAIIVNLIDKVIRKRNNQVQGQLVDKGNNILSTQLQLVVFQSEKLIETKNNAGKAIQNRHQNIEDKFNEINSSKYNEEEHETNQNKLDDINSILNDW